MLCLGMLTLGLGKSGSCSRPATKTEPAKEKRRLRLSLRLVRHVPRQASQLSGMCLPNDFSCDAWRGTCLTRRRDISNLIEFKPLFLLMSTICRLSPHPLLMLFSHVSALRPSHTPAKWMPTVQFKDV